jgi:hypothetical protein
MDDVGLHALAQLTDQCALLQVRARREREVLRLHAGFSQRGDERVRAVPRFRDHCHNDRVSPSHLSRREREHDRLEAADFARCDDLKNCPPAAIFAATIHAI